jgi:hypothetical protein
LVKDWLARHLVKADGVHRSRGSSVGDGWIDQGPQLLEERHAHGAPCAIKTMRNQTLRNQNDAQSDPAQSKR